MAISNSDFPDANLLRRMHLFSNLSEAVLNDIAAHARVRFAHRGEILFQKGDRARHFYGIALGWIEVFNRQENGDEAILGVFANGETFAEAAMFLGRTYPANAEAIEDSRIFEFDHTYFEREIYSQPEICRGMLASMSKHLHAMTKEVEHLKSRNSEQRLALFLARLCHSDHEPCTITLPYDKSLIASRLGMKPETLSRTFSKLRTLGVVVQREHVTISNPKRLLNHALASQG